MPMYRTVEYSIRRRSDNKWRWAAYAKKGSGNVIDSGEVKGPPQQAEAAAKAAIDRWLSAKSTTVSDEE